MRNVATRYSVLLTPSSSVGLGVLNTVVRALTSFKTSAAFPTCSFGPSLSASVLGSFPKYCPPTLVGPSGSFFLDEVQYGNGVLLVACRTYLRRAVWYHSQDFRILYSTRRRAYLTGARPTRVPYRRMDYTCTLRTGELHVGITGRRRTVYITA